MSIEINNESGVSVDEVALVGLGRSSWTRLSVNPMVELSIVLLDPDAMAALHRQWMDVEGPTDVMAFPMDVEELSAEHAEPSGPPRLDANSVGALLGDVVLCPEVAAEQARQAGHSSDGTCNCSVPTASCTCSGTTTASPRRSARCSRCKRARRGLGRAVRACTDPGPRPGTRGEVRDTAAGDRSGERHG